MKITKNQLRNLILSEVKKSKLLNEFELPGAADTLEDLFNDHLGDAIVDMKNSWLSWYDKNDPDFVVIEQENWENACEDAAEALSEEILAAVNNVVSDYLNPKKLRVVTSKKRWG